MQEYREQIYLLLKDYDNTKMSRYKQLFFFCLDFNK